ncbi:hypothetical protein DXG01_012090 [Tephrocybe rancida]|nr:hypothetical protein DXG01_012090 [Tephrocybe rancida]
MNQVFTLRARKLRRSRRLKEAAAAATAATGYAQAEKLRNEEYHRSVHERSQQFDEECEKHAEGEDQRRSQFTSLVASCGIAAEAHKGHCDSRYKASSARWDAAFCLNYAARNTVFNNAERNWVLLHRQGQDMRGEDGETYEKMRDKRFKDGHQARIVLCADLENALENQVQDLLLAQETFFVLNEDRRSAIMAAMAVEQGPQAPLDTEQDISHHIFCPQPVYPTRPSAFPVPSIERKMDEPPAEVTETQSPVLTADIDNRGTSTISSSPTSDTHQLSADIPLFNIGGNNLPYGDHNSIMALVADVLGSDLSESQSGDSASTSRYTSPDETVQTNPTTSDTLLTAGTPTTVPLGSFANYAAISCSPTTTSSANANDSSTTTSDKRSANSHLNQRDISEESFRSAETQRQIEYMLEERDRKERHAAEETAREEAERDRTNVFTNKMAIWHTEHILQASSLEARFTKSEVMRNGSDDHHHSRFTFQQGLFLWDCRANWLRIRQSFSMKDEAEMKATRTMCTRLAGLVRMQILLLQPARRERTIRFSTAHRSLTAPAHPVQTVSYVPCATPVNSESRPKRVLFVANPWSGSEESISCKSRKGGGSWRGPDGRTRSLSPPTGFALGHLFKTINFRDTLPVPSKEEPIYEDHSERRRQYMFNQSQAQREAAFENGAVVRQHGFLLNEAKRQLRFENMQKERLALFEDSRGKWEMKFQEAQADRERYFSTAEELREVKFNKAQQSREVQFRQSEEEFDKQFRSTQEELQKMCHEGEEKRLRDLEVWGTDLMESRERERKLFEMEEKEREELFQQGLRILRIQRAV